MKILLDENLPKKLKRDFPHHEIYTVHDMGWTGKKNGELMKLLIAENFDILLTFDKNLGFQQNFNKYQLAVFALSAADNTYDVLKNLVGKINEALEKPLQIGVTDIKEDSSF
jgi:predicted nuclease of predicted toxin-antitoxin system